MEDDDTALYQACLARDPRFDGVFFVGVISTRIYCRPVCPARPPRRESCRFFSSAAAAEREGFRPCLRCRPELAPGLAPIDDAHRIASLFIQRLEERDADQPLSLEQTADEFQLSTRQLRRIVQSCLGVSPLHLIQTRRLLLARQLLAETALPLTQIALASGFSSLRRLNAACIRHSGLPPSQMRSRNAPAMEKESITLHLSYRPPYDWTAVLGFLARRIIPQIEYIGADVYRRTVRIGAYSGWIDVGHKPQRRMLRVTVSMGLLPVLPTVLHRVRALFDLDARPDIISEHLRQSPMLSEIVSRHPGLRVPGAFDGFEIAVRAIVCQQITLHAATRVVGRLVENYGESCVTPFDRMQRLFPSPAVIAELEAHRLSALGLPAKRAECVCELAKHMALGHVRLDAGMPYRDIVSKLRSLRGIGPWTAQSIAMRALGYPDAFSGEDVVIRKIMACTTAREAEAVSQPWRPWRSYATLYLWMMARERESKSKREKV